MNKLIRTIEICGLAAAGYASAYLGHDTIRKISAEGRESCQLIIAMIEKEHPTEADKARLCTSVWLKDCLGKTEICKDK